MTKSPAPAEAPIAPDITLVNPVAHHFDAFIFGNGTKWEEMAMAELHRVAPEAITPDLNLESFRHALFEHCTERFVVEKGSAKGQHLILCGAGPSLADHAAEYCPQGDQVWGCNSAATYLRDRGHRVTHAFTVDQTPAMLNEWKSAPDVEYLLASSCHPHLSDFLMKRSRRIRFFHNFVGVDKPPLALVDKAGVTRGQISFEDWLYQCFFPGTVMAGSGLNAVTRAIDVAQYMGFSRITVLGADCALRHTSPPPDVDRNSRRYRKWAERHTTMHADGGSALASGATAVMLQAEIDGRVWLTKPDMCISAQWLVYMTRAAEGQIEIIGDTFPGALMDKDETFMARLPHFVDNQGRRANIPQFLKNGEAARAQV